MQRTQSYGSLLFLFALAFVLQAAPVRFTIGSTSQEVHAAMGTPTRIDSYSHRNREIWHYSLSSVTLEGGRVLEWDDISNNLRAHLGDVQPGSLPFTLGSSEQQVLDAMGTPNSIDNYSRRNREVWHYSLSSVTLEGDRVIDWDDVSSNLRVTVAPVAERSNPNPQPRSVSPASYYSTRNTNTPSPYVAENGSYYGQISTTTGRPKTGAFPFCGPYSSIFESWVGTVARRYRSSHRPAL